MPMTRLLRNENNVYRELGGENDGSWGWHYGMGLPSVITYESTLTTAMKIMSKFKKTDLQYSCPDLD